MSCWLTIPSKRTPDECGPTLAKWRERGYKIALFVESIQEVSGKPHDLWMDHDTMPDGVRLPRYPGYAIACNFLIKQVMVEDQFIPGTGPIAEWFICAGDDILPDPNHTAEEISTELRANFSNLHHNFAEYEPPEHADAVTHPFTAFARTMTGQQMETFGVMQPTGDRYGEQPNHPDPEMRSAYADRVCGSAWIGREFARRMYGGKGPLWPEYFHMGCDEELQHVALKYGVLWQRRDLTQYHHHWARKRGSVEDRPSFLERASGPGEWTKYKALFEARKAAGFPGSDPL